MFSKKLGGYGPFVPPGHAYDSDQKCFGGPCGGKSISGAARNVLKDEAVGNVEINP